MSSDNISTSFDPIHALVSLINTSVATLETACKDVRTPWPSLDDPVYMSQTGPTPEQIVLMTNNSIANASATLIAAAMQLLSTIRVPQATALHAGLSVSSA